MKLNQLIMEKLDDTGITLEKLLAKIRQDCDVFLDQSVAPLYRGDNRLSSSPKTTLSGFLNKSLIRKHRKALDNDQDFNNEIDRLTQDAVGFKMRSEGLFTTTSKEIASNYGKVGLVFPIGDFKFVSSPLVSDMYFTFFDAGTETWPKELDDIMTPYIEDYLGRSLEKTAGAEFSYIPSIEQRAIVLTAIEENSDTFFKSTQLAALQSTDHEIIINNSAGYYLIFEDQLRDTFEVSGLEFYEMLKDSD